MEFPCGRAVKDQEAAVSGFDNQPRIFHKSQAQSKKKIPLSKLKKTRVQNLRRWFLSLE